jgi:hypothetical protein
MPRRKISDSVRKVKKTIRKRRRRTLRGDIHRNVYNDLDDHKKDATQEYMVKLLAALASRQQTAPAGGGGSSQQTVNIPGNSNDRRNGNDYDYDFLQRFLLQQVPQRDPLNPLRHEIPVVRPPPVPVVQPPPPPPLPPRPVRQPPPPAAAPLPVQNKRVRDPAVPMVDDDHPNYRPGMGNGLPPQPPPPAGVNYGPEIDRLRARVEIGDQNRDAAIASYKAYLSNYTTTQNAEMAKYITSFNASARKSDLLRATVEGMEKKNLNIPNEINQVLSQQFQSVDSITNTGVRQILQSMLPPGLVTATELDQKISSLRVPQAGVRGITEAEAKNITDTIMRGLLPDINDRLKKSVSDASQNIQAEASKEAENLRRRLVELEREKEEIFTYHTTVVQDNSELHKQLLASNSRTQELLGQVKIDQETAKEMQKLLEEIGKKRFEALDTMQQLETQKRALEAAAQLNANSAKKTKDILQRGPKPDPALGNLKKELVTEAPRQTQSSSSSSSSQPKGEPVKPQPTPQPNPEPLPAPVSANPPVQPEEDRGIQLMNDAAVDQGLGIIGYQPNLSPTTTLKLPNTMSDVISKPPSEVKTKYVDYDIQDKADMSATSGYGPIVKQKRLPNAHPYKETNDFTQVPKSATGLADAVNADIGIVESKSNMQPIITQSQPEVIETKGSPPPQSQQNLVSSAHEAILRAQQQAQAEGAPVVVEQKQNIPMNDSQITMPVNPIGPSGGSKKLSKDGLSDDEILAMVKKSGNAVTHVVRGINAKDEVQNMTLPKNKPSGLIINTDPSSRGGEHWVSLYVDPRPNVASVEYYDSLGHQPSRSMSNGIYKMIKNNFGELPHMLKFKVNSVKNQRATSPNCGFFALKFLTDRAHGQTFENASGFKVLSQSARGEYGISLMKKKFGYV